MHIIYRTTLAWQILRGLRASYTRGTVTDTVGPVPLSRPRPQAGSCSRNRGTGSSDLSQAQGLHHSVAFPKVALRDAPQQPTRVPVSHPLPWPVAPASWLHGHQSPQVLGCLETSPRPRQEAAWGQHLGQGVRGGSTHLHPPAVCLGVALLLWFSVYSPAATAPQPAPSFLFTQHPGRA